MISMKNTETKYAAKLLSWAGCPQICMVKQEFTEGLERKKEMKGEGFIMRPRKQGEA